MSALIPIHNVSTHKKASAAEKQLRGILNHVPGKYLTGLTAVVLMDEPFNRQERRWRNNDGRLGEYDPDGKTIILFLKHIEDVVTKQASFPFWVRDVFFHELGHHCDMWLRRSSGKSKSKLERAADDWSLTIWKSYVKQRYAGSFVKIVWVVGCLPKPIARRVGPPVLQLINLIAFERESISPSRRAWKD